VNLVERPGPAARIGATLEEEIRESCDRVAAFSPRLTNPREAGHDG